MEKQDVNTVCMQVNNKSALQLCETGSANQDIQFAYQYIKIQAHGYSLVSNVKFVKRMG